MKLAQGFLFTLIVFGFGLAITVIVSDLADFDVGSLGCRAFTTLAK